MLWNAFKNKILKAKPVSHTVWIIYISLSILFVLLEMLIANIVYIPF